MKDIDHSTINIRANGNSNSNAVLTFAHKSMPCIIGHGGIKARKMEGDGATPAGKYNIVYGFYRADRLARLSSNIKMIPIRQDFGWCDDPQGPLYNRFITLPTKWRHEKLWREDHLYDICLVLDHNMLPRRRHGGSAIFFHLKHTDDTPTQGCIAISPGQMRKILGQCSGQSKIVVHL